MRAVSLRHGYTRQDLVVPMPSPQEARETTSDVIELFL